MDSNTYEELIHAICEACHADSDDSSCLTLPESQHALRALGLYPSLEDIEKEVERLGLQFPLDPSAFKAKMSANSSSSPQNDELTNHS